jgi:phosphonate transport system permease protein
MADKRYTKEDSIRASLVPPPVAGVLSLIVPGLGQILARQVRRGLLLLACLLSSVGLLAWRMRLTARREVGALAIFRKAVGKESILAALTVGVVLLWLWIAWDGYQQARSGRRAGGVGIFLLVILLFFVLGWQITEIDLVKLATEFDDALPALSKVLWPWEKAFIREESVLMGAADIQVPCCDESPPPPPEEVPGQPYVVAEPTCGELSYQDESYKMVAGTTLTLRGRGFAPNTETEIWWADSMNNKFRVRQEGEYLKTVTDGEGAFELKVIMPYRLIPPSAAEGPMIHQIRAQQVSEVGGLLPSGELKLAIEKMVETIFLGLIATLFGIVLAVPVSFLAARNLMSASGITMAVYYLVRTLLNIVRSIEPLIWAIIAVLWVGLGPFAGVIALTVHSIAALGKLYSESIESIDPGPIEAIMATGANRLQTIMYAVVPQVLPPFISFTIYRWDINVRMSTIIGAVGGGGIGFLLIQWIRLLDYRSAGIAVWFIAITVAVLDFVSAEVRERFV